MIVEEAAVVAVAMAAAKAMVPVIVVVLMVAGVGKPVVMARAAERATLHALNAESGATTPGSVARMLAVVAVEEVERQRHRSAAKSLRSAGKRRQPRPAAAGRSKRRSPSAPKPWPYNKSNGVSMMMI